MNRRVFLRNNGLALAGVPFLSGHGIIDRENRKSGERVQFTRDGLDLDPSEYTELLREIAGGEDVVDNYSRSGVVKRMENKFAELLGMEDAVFMPTGTLANLIAIRKHAGLNRRVLVQADSHIYNDTGDGAQVLAGLNLIPLAEGKTSFTLDEVKSACEWNDKGRVKTVIGAISVESPVRRRNNEMFNFNEMVKISEYARSRGIKMHLDGARLFNAVAHSGIPANEYASLFDTVYISLYKDFNAASGAVLCGPKAFMEGLYHTRRMFGGGMPQVWPFASVALHFADSFLPDYREAMKRFTIFSEILNSRKEFEIKTIGNGTNVFVMKVITNDINGFIDKLASNSIELPPPAENIFYPKINTTLLRVDPEKLAGYFSDAL
ncbi:MAG: beta-eliminating lyase-related protein [Bacteroidales bacterium]|nr:beta-eliminating lyase-related protein [Bacteroidales bacterium]